MDRRVLIAGAILAAIVIAVGATLLVRKRQSDAAAEAQRQRVAAAQAVASAKYQRLKSVDDEAGGAFDRFMNADHSYDVTQAGAALAGQRRHDLFAQQPVDYADALTDVRNEKSDVEQLQELSQEKSDAARGVATALGSYFGESTSSSLLADITNASEAEGKYLADWWRATSQINDTLTAQVNGRWYMGSSDDVESLYRASDEEGAVSRSRWGSVNARLSELHDRLRNDMVAVQAEMGSAATTLATIEPSSVPPVVAQTDNPIPQNPASNPQSSIAADVADSPLSAGNVLPLLRATSALSVSTKPDGSTAYVTVPDTPAKGTADPNRVWIGRMADGRWVGIVPLDSGGSAGIAYALMWVWTDGRAQFVGEIPAENDGLGHLSMTIDNGEIYLKWPVSGGLVRTKVLTLDGIRLRPLSDTTGPAS